MFDTALAPIGYIKHRPPNMLRVAVNQYTPEGRATIHNRLESVNMYILTYLMRNPVRGKSMEYNDNRLSLYCGQGGQCAISEQTLEIGHLHCHHIKPLHKGGGDTYSNLLFVTDTVHRLLHATTEETIKSLLDSLNLDRKQLAKVNKFRRLAELPELI